MLALHETAQTAWRRAFTIYELATVCGLVAGLFGMIGVSIVDYVKDRKVEQARRDCQILATACEWYADQNPDQSLDHFSVLLSETRCGKPIVPATLSGFVDPWGQPYQLHTEEAMPGVRFRVSTVTPSGVEISN
ncbi:MAG: hypothetical protein LC104_13440 [Bacteroidales bacterium]|nr:hypothetical protein [Bacteroidales bacterium]